MSARELIAGIIHLFTSDQQAAVGNAMHSAMHCQDDAISRQIQYTHGTLK